MFAELLLNLLVEKAPPGHTALSLMPAPECVLQDQGTPCAAAQWSDFYAAWMRREDPVAGRARLQAATLALVAETSALLCLSPEGTNIEGCTPAPGARSPQGARWWGVQRLSLLAASVATMESGFREDVQNGRGWAKGPSQDGGRGRGPGWEGCFMQVHPSIAWRFALHAPAELRAQAEAGDEAAREAVVQTLLGGGDEALRHCWGTGLRMLLNARAYCAWAAPETGYLWATVAMYGTGNSCTAPNNGKTAVRVRFYDDLARGLRAASSTRASGAS